MQKQENRKQRAHCRLAFKIKTSRFSGNLLVKYTYSDYDLCDSWTWPSSRFIYSYL